MIDAHDEYVKNSVAPSNFQGLLYMPANISKTGLTYLLAQNNETGIIFETESDTLNNSLNGSEHGKFSDILRKAFQSESCSFYRSTSREHIELRSPKISTILSSTYDQLELLIPSYENGLFSRFIFYAFESENKFAKVFDNKKSSYPSSFKALSIKFKNVYDRLSQRGNIDFKLNKKQEKKFQLYFEKTYEELITYISQDLSGTIFRLGLICFRICMIFSTLRLFENNSTSIPKVIKCSDQDLDKAIQLIEIFRQNSQDIFFRLTPSKKQHNNQASSSTQLQKAMKLWDHGKGKSYQEIAKELRLSSKGVAYNMIQKEHKRLNGSKSMS